MLYEVQEEIYADFQRYVKQVSFYSPKIVVLCIQTAIFLSLVKTCKLSAREFQEFVSFRDFKTPVPEMIILFIKINGLSPYFSIQSKLDGLGTSSSQECNVLCMWVNIHTKNTFTLNI